jgi:hypothetical protein
MLKKKSGRPRTSARTDRSVKASQERVANAVWDACPDQDKLLACLASDAFADKAPRVSSAVKRNVAGDLALHNIAQFLVADTDRTLRTLVASGLVDTESVGESKVLRDALRAEAKALGKLEQLESLWPKARLEASKEQRRRSLGSRTEVRALFAPTPRKQLPLMIVRGLRDIVSEVVLVQDSAGRGVNRAEPQHFMVKSWGSTYFEDIVPSMAKVYQRVWKDNKDYELPALKKNVEETKWQRGMRILKANNFKLDGLKSVACQADVEGLGPQTIVSFSSRTTRQMVKRCSKDFAWAGRGLLICGTRMGSFCVMCRVSGPKYKRRLAELEANDDADKDEVNSVRREVAKYEFHLFLLKTAYFWIGKVRLLLVRQPEFEKACMCVMDYGTVKDSTFADIKFLVLHIVERDVGSADDLGRRRVVITFRKRKTDEWGSGADGECCIRLMNVCLESFDVFVTNTHLFLQSDSGNGFHGVDFLGFLSGVRGAFKKCVQYHYRPPGHASGPQDGVVNTVNRVLTKAVERGVIVTLGDAVELLRRKMENTEVFDAGDVMDVPRGLADEHPCVSAAPGISTSSMITFPCGGVAVGRPSMGETEKSTTWRLWADLDWCSYCTRVHPERKLVKRHSKCPSRGKKDAVFVDPFLKAFAAVKEFHEAGGLASLRSRDPDLELGKDCLRDACMDVSESESEAGIGLDTESEEELKKRQEPGRRRRKVAPRASVASAAIVDQWT